MSDLTDARDWARKMSTAQHKPECEGHAPTRWGWARTLRPDPKCSGCVTDADRAMWKERADEYDAYLAREDEADLFGEVGT
jgi:hypothetical protein